MWRRENTSKWNWHIKNKNQARKLIVLHQKTNKNCDSDLKCSNISEKPSCISIEFNNYCREFYACLQNPSRTISWFNVIINTLHYTTLFLQLFNTLITQKIVNPFAPIGHISSKFLCQACHWGIKKREVVTEGQVLPPEPRIV